MGVKELAEQYEEYVIEQRRWFHQHAELSWKEFETTAHIEEELRKMGIEPQKFEGLTGCWAIIKGGKANKKWIRNWAFTLSMFAGMLISMLF